MFGTKLTTQRTTAFKFSTEYTMFRLLFRTTCVLLWVATVSSLSSDAAAGVVAAGSNGSNTSVQFHPKTFTPAETRVIIQQMKTLPVEFDERIDKSVRRTNYFDQGSSVTSPDSKYRWIFERIQPLYYAPDDHQSLETFVSDIDFILLHEFNKNDFFDWHVDTKPGDGTGRTYNINVMLTDRSDYDGGALMVGVHTVSAQQGDCYWYPAAFPHKVGDITRNQRHTLIIAMKKKETTPPPELESSARRQEYWKMVEENHKSICELKPTESKLHMLYGEFLAALGRPDEEVDAKFADMYASTPEANQYVSSFLQQGEQLKQLGKTKESTGYFSMAAMIQNRMSKS